MIELLSSAGDAGNIAMTAASRICQTLAGIQHERQKIVGAHSTGLFKDLGDKQLGFRKQLSQLLRSVADAEYSQLPPVLKSKQDYQALCSEWVTQDLLFEESDAALKSLNASQFFSDVRYNQDVLTGRRTALLMLGFRNSQLLPRDNAIVQVALIGYPKTTEPTLRVAVGLGIKPVLTVDDAATLENNGRLIAGDFPSSVIFSLSKSEMLTCESICVTWSGSKRVYF